MRNEASLWPDRETIPPLPMNVPEAYEKILNRVSVHEKGKVETILRIIIGARRPLTIGEMAMALGVATTSEAETAIEASLNPDGLAEKIRRLCGLFVFIKDLKIYLIHQTAQEFLISKVDKSPDLTWYLEPSQTELHMTQICVRYLLMNDLISNNGKSVRILLYYCAENWADHFRYVLAPEDEIVHRVWRLYDVGTELFRLWFPIFWKTAMPYHRDRKIKKLHLAVFNGHRDILTLVLMSKTGSIEEVDGWKTNALQWESIAMLSKLLVQEDILILFNNYLRTGPMSTRMERS
ncbi:hypothetical protein EYB25_002386 [Talaromyces marneffei]|nr:hypothetical protein EYB25_002386 [Talaromyces marneffei]